MGAPTLHQQKPFITEINDKVCCILFRYFSSGIGGNSDDFLPGTEECEEGLDQGGGFREGGGSLRPTEIGGESPIGAFSSQRHTRGWSVGPGSRIGARSWASFVLIGG